MPGAGTPDRFRRPALARRLPLLPLPFPSTAAAALSCHAHAPTALLPFPAALGAAFRRRASGPVIAVNPRFGGHGIVAT